MISAPNESKGLCQFLLYAFVCRFPRRCLPRPSFLIDRWIDRYSIQNRYLHNYLPTYRPKSGTLAMHDKLDLTPPQLYSIQLDSVRFYSNTQ